MKLSRLFGRVAITLALAISALTAAPVVSANAGWLPGDNQEVTTTYYSDATRTVVVGQTVYGNCGNDYSWGDDSAYLSRTLTDC
ncbi:MAG: hypothetical protein QOE53_907 [Pseudonocardiales bacterium]|jgi:hypothetical protein|nr:hypothetical protein [Pseudonocardiales bacterium]